jgi:NAD(P)-dependent dehydrogenase (short-subunit alcohol dehydrogenase family)
VTTALITGAYRGIGFEVARQLGERGAHVFVTARRRDAGAKAAATLQKSGAKISFVELDVTDAKSIRNAVESVAEQVDHLEVLVNNAAILEDGDENVLALDGEILMRTLETNTLGPLRVTQGFLPLLAKSKDARIINVSSGGGQLSEMGTWSPAYCISKTALNAITCQLAGALRDKEIPVNSVCPGWVRTDMGGKTAPRSVEEGVDTIVWLATEAPRSLTGKFLRDHKEIPW